MKGRLLFVEGARQPVKTMRATHPQARMQTPA